MSMRTLLALSGLLVLSGCLYHVREQTDRTVCELAVSGLDARQPPCTEPAPPTEGMQATSRTGKPHVVPALGALDISASTVMANDREPEPTKKSTEVSIPDVIPGADTERIKKLPEDKAERARVLSRLYPKLEPLPIQPVAVAGPDGQPYTLTMLHEIAALNSPALRQAAADLQGAEGNLIAARAYPNPTVALLNQPSNDGSTAGVMGASVDQLIKTGGKLHLLAAAAEEDRLNSELALRKARSDLASAVRNSYYTLLVAHETMRVSHALAQFTDQMYDLQRGQLEAGLSTAYEPAALRAQVWATRLAYKQSIDGYVYAWKQLVATIGLRQLPLSEVAGRADRAIPYFDYDEVLAYVLENHTDVQSARNAIEKARYNLKLAQVTPASPDLEVQFAALKEFALAPQQWAYSVQVGVPLPIWDRNKGQIMAAEAALVRATEQPRSVEQTLTTNLATACQSYKTNLEALEYYRRYILPDQVRAYRGIYERRQVEPAWSATNFNDLLTSQQTLVSGVTTYLGILGQLWTSAISVANLLQTDDLFQHGQPLELPPLPALHEMLRDASQAH